MKIELFRRRTPGKGVFSLGEPRLYILDLPPLVRARDPEGNERPDVAAAEWQKVVCSSKHIAFWVEYVSR